MPEFQTFTEERLLQSNRFVCYFMPRADSVRAFLSVGNQWNELYKTDFSNGDDSNFFGYDPVRAVVTVDSDLLGNKLRVQYDHDGDVNPGVIDVLPIILGQWVKQQNYQILDGISIRKSVVNGVIAGDPWVMHITGGSIVFDGEVYSVCENIHSLHNFGGSHGIDMVTAFVMFFTRQQFVEAKTTKLIHGPIILKSASVEYGDGGGLNSALSEVYVTLQKKYGLGMESSEYVEAIRGGVLSRGSDPPSLFVHYAKQYRFLNLQM
jgi:hypothetical protein